MSFENNDKKFERRSTRPRFDKPRFDRPRPENVVRAIGDKDAAPQVAVGGLKEVEALLENEPLRLKCGKTAGDYIQTHLGGTQLIYDHIFNTQSSPQSEP